MMEDIDAAEVKRYAKQSGKAALEQKFLDAWGAEYGTLPKPTRQHQFHPSRKWRFDFAWVDQKLAVEIQGGAFIRGGHSRGAGQAKDYEKQNAAVLLGWRVLCFNTKQMGNPESVVDDVATALTNAGPVS